MAVTHQLLYIGKEREKKNIGNTTEGAQKLCRRPQSYVHREKENDKR